MVLGNNRALCKVLGDGATRVPRLLFQASSAFWNTSYGVGGWAWERPVGPHFCHSLLTGVPPCYHCCQFCLQHLCLNDAGLRERALSPLCSFGHGRRSSLSWSNAAGAGWLRLFPPAGLHLLDYVYSCLWRRQVKQMPLLQELGKLCRDSWVLSLP